ncbi:MAG: hypothetical protein ACKO7W_19265 [Elainella sp.]
MSYSASSTASLIAALTAAADAFAQATETTAIATLLLDLVQSQTVAEQAVLVQPLGETWQVLGQTAGQGDLEADQSGPLRSLVKIT